MGSTRDELIARYRHLRAIGVQQHNEVMVRFLSVSAILEYARNIGLAVGRTFVVDDADHLSLAYDLAIYTAPPGRSRAIDRYAKAAKLGAELDEGKVLAAKCRVQFSIWQIERRHEAAGVVVRDLLRARDTWLIDEGLELTGEGGMTFASRVSWPADFAMGCGVLVPLIE